MGAIVAGTTFTVLKKGLPKAKDKIKDLFKKKPK